MSNFDAWDYAPMAVAGGATAGGYKAFSDLERISAQARKWDRNLDNYRNNFLTWDKLQADNFKVNPKITDRIIDRYIRDGRKLAQSKVFGIPVGKLLQQLRPGAASHYDLFTNPKFSNKDVRLHLLVKAWNENASDARPAFLGGANQIPEIARIQDIGNINQVHVADELKDALRGILTTNKDLKISDMVKRLEAAAEKIPLKPEGKGPPGIKSRAGAQAFIKELKYSIYGGRPEGLSGTSRQMAEILRLAGIHGNEISTPAVYSRRLGGIVDKITRYKNPTMVFGGALTGLLGLNALSKKTPWEKIKDWFSERGDLTKSSSTAEAVTNAILPSGLTAGGVAALASRTPYENIFRPQNNLAVTFGEMEKPYFLADIGAGHREPALSVRELLSDAIRKNPEKWGLLNPEIDILNRDRYGRLNPDFYDRSYNTIIDTGLGINRQPGWVSTGLEASHAMNVDPNIKAQNMAYLQTDMTHPGRLGEMGAAHPRLGDGLENWNRALNHMMLGTGPGSRRAYLKNHGGGLAPGLSFEKVTEGSQPAIRQAAYDILSTPPEDRASMIDKAIHSKGGVLDPDIADKYKGGLDAPIDVARKLEELKKPGTKYIFISGSGRGDYVATRAYELAEKLAKAGQDDVKVVALMAQSYGKTEHKMMDLLKLSPHKENIIALPRLPQRQFIDIARNSDIHLGSFGSSAFSEALGSQAVMGMPSEWGKRTWWSDEDWRIAEREGYNRFLDPEVDVPKSEANPAGKYRPFGRDTPIPGFHEYGDDNAWRSSFKPGSTADRDLRILARRGLLTPEYIEAIKEVNVDQWNEGNQHYFHNEVMEDAKSKNGVKHSVKGGAFQADDMDEVVKVISDDGLLNKLKKGAVERAAREFFKISVGRENLINGVLGKAVEAIRRQKVRGVARLLGGLGLLGLGGAGMVNAAKGY